MSSFYENLGPITDAEGWIRYRDPRWFFNEAEIIPRLMIGYGLALAGFGIVLLVQPHWSASDLLAVPLGLLMALIGDLMLKRVRSTAIRPESEGIRIRSVFTTTLIPWRRIAGFTFRQGARMLLTNGRLVPVTGIRGSRQRTEVTSLIEQLNATLEQRTGRRAVTSPLRPLEALGQFVKNLRTPRAPPVPPAP